MPDMINLPNEAVLMDDIGKLDLRAYPLVLPSSSEKKPIIPTGCTLVRIKVTGICGSDVGTIICFDKAICSLPQNVVGGQVCGLIIEADSFVETRQRSRDSR